ncbi:TPA_asm: hypothetical protein [Porphyromonas phage phage023a_KCOM2797]|uniref:Uncharacterized protein n=1 Tax=Porphyromonas phage phage023a_KCOM2797 TaxID=3154113 RepID=A0AAT9JCZ5_9CAUD
MTGSPPLCLCAEGVSLLIEYKKTPSRRSRGCTGFDRYVSGYYPCSARCRVAMSSIRSTRQGREDALQRNQIPAERKLTR